MDPTYSVVEIQSLETGWVYIDMWKEPLPAELLRQHADITIYVRPWASKWTKRQNVASGLSAEEARQVVHDERKTVEDGFFHIGNTKQRILPTDANAPEVPLLMHVSWTDMVREHPELQGYEPDSSLMAHGESSRMVKCGNCGAQLPEEWSSKGDEERPPCPDCGSTKIDVSLQPEDRLKLGDTVATTRLGSEQALARWVVDRPRHDGLAVAVRAALRCLWFPICESRHAEELSLIGLRLCALGVLVATNENAQPRTPSRQLVRATNDERWYKSQAAMLWRDVARLLDSVSHQPPEFADAVVDVARHAADVISNPADPEDSWAELDADVRVIFGQPGHALFETELFSPSVSKYILDEVRHSNYRYSERRLGFLADWYESIIAGRVDTELLREIVRIPDRDWAQGAEHVRDLIAEFEAARRLRDATPLAEKIYFDDRSGKLRVEPVRMLPPDLYDTGLEKLQDAVDDAREASERNPNSYTALQPTLEMLDRTLTKYRDNPQRVHDDQLLAVRRVRQLLKEGYVPDDAEIASLIQVLDTNAVDIRAAIPAVAVAVKKRSEVRIRELDPAERNCIRSAVDAVASASDESLAEEMREDDRATFESGGVGPDIESPYRVASRLAAVASILHSLEQIAGFVDRHGPLIASLGITLLSALAKLLGL